MSFNKTLSKYLLTLMIGLAISPVLLIGENPAINNKIIEGSFYRQKIIQLKRIGNQVINESFSSIDSFQKNLSKNKFQKNALSVNEFEEMPFAIFTCSDGVLENADFESDFSYWNFYNNCIITNDAHYGAKAAMVQSGSGGVGQNVAAFAGQVYALDVYAKKSGTEQTSIGIKFLDSGWNEIGASYTYVNSSSFELYQLSALAPENTAYVQAVAWKSPGTGTATFDGFCLQAWEVAYNVCANTSCEIKPSWGNYVWSMDDSGADNNWKDYDTGGLMLCDNGNGTLTLKGNLINGQDADWHVSNGAACGPQDGWYLELTLSDRQDWSAFQGAFEQNAGCAANHTNWDYWDITGSLTGIGCNTGRSIDINGPANGYRLQIGWGGNSQSCNFGLSAWFSATEGGTTFSADIYANIDADCYNDTKTEDCVDGVDNDNDGLADCYDSDCGPQLIVNQSFEDTGGESFNDSFEGNPAIALDNGSTILPNWKMDYGCGGNCFDSYWIDDTADRVNNPKGDYFLWIPGSSYCARQSISVDMDKCYEITMTVASWSVPSPQLSTNIVLEAFGGGINDDGGLLAIYEAELPASPNWQNLNWQTLKFTWSPPASANTRFYISQTNTSTTARGLAVDEISIKEICCAGNSVTPEISCEDGRDVEFNFVGINNDVPNTLNIADDANIESIIVEVVYKGGNPGSSITVEDADNNSYSASRQSVGSNAYVYRTTLPATSAITYSNTNNENKAQSLSAFVFRNNQPGKTVVTEFTTVGGYNDTYTLDFNIPKGVVPRNVKLTLPISEVTYDDRRLDFVATAGSVTTSFSRLWGPNGLGFPNGCCMDTVEFYLPNVAPETDLVSIDIISPGNGEGQSFVIAATIGIEVFCEEICGNGIDDDGDGLVDNEDPECLCPEIYTTDTTYLEICEGETVDFEVATNAPNPPYSYIDFWRFDNPQSNPYTSGDVKVWLGAFQNNNNGTGSISSGNFPTNGASSSTYYVYGCVKPSPPDPDSCAPLIEYVVVVNPSPTAAAGADATICGGSSTNLMATASGGPGPYSFAWDNGLGNGANHTVTPSTTTTYTVTVSGGNGCTDADQVKIGVNQSPTVDAGQDVTICPLESTTLNASGIGVIDPYSYQWSHGLGVGALQVVSPAATTTYSVTLTNGNGCIDIDQVTVTVGNCIEICVNGLDDDGDGLIDCEDDDCQPVPDAGADVSICLGTSTILTATVPDGFGSFTYEWSNGLGGGASKTINPLVTTTYTVTVTNVAGCTGTDDVTVVVETCPEDCTDGVDNDGDGLIDCDDPDCEAIAAPLLEDDAFTSCPGIPFTDRVIYNDGNLQNPTYSIFALPTYGLVTIDGTGKFTYTPLSSDCLTDFFVYEVCNQTTGCCATAGVTITIGDTDPPVIMNIPADITIGCDELVPSPPQVLAFDACPGIFIDYQEVSNEYTAGACEEYQITRTWVATDLCGNSSSGTQTIFVEDLEGPEIFRVYTLDNGAKVLAGISSRATNNWKYVNFPITFSTKPVVFSQLVSNNEVTAATILHRNITEQGFELRLNEQEASDGVHLPEQVAWLAMEKGIVPGMLEADSLANVSDAVSSLILSQTYSSSPHFFAALQTVNETEPTTVRISNATGMFVDLFLDEETSKDSETDHADEEIAYLALAPGQQLQDVEGDFIGETGSLNLSNAWAVVSLSRTYTKPVVIMGSPTNDDNEPVTVRVRNVTSESFEVRLQEWDYQDGNHGLENIAYLVVEGSLPDSQGEYCTPDELKFQNGVNVFAVDNCDNQIDLDFYEVSSMLDNGLQVMRTWAATDDCGNTVSYNRNDTCTVAAFKIRTALYGAIVGNGGGNLMRDDLRQIGLVPTSEPFTDLFHFYHAGRGGGESILPSQLNVTGDDAIVDWVFLEVRDPATPNSVLSTVSALLQRDGDIVNIDGGDVIYFPELREGTYFVAVRHRNHLGFMSAKSWYLSSTNVPILDFTDLTTDVNGGISSGRIHNGIRTQWPGDMNGDRKIIYQGPFNDVFFLFSRVLSDANNTGFLANYISTGYDMHDMNLDGKIIYQGPQNERAMLLYHTILSHPDNDSFLANFIVSEKLP